jgi:hypothetical protein
MVNVNVWGQIKSGVHLILGFKFYWNLFSNKNSLTLNINIVKKNIGEWEIKIKEFLVNEFL